MMSIIMTRDREKWCSLVATSSANGGWWKRREKWERIMTILIGDSGFWHTMVPGQLRPFFNIVTLSQLHVFTSSAAFGTMCFKNKEKCLTDRNLIIAMEYASRSCRSSMLESSNFTDSNSWVQTMNAGNSLSLNALKHTEIYTLQ